MTACSTVDRPLANAEETPAPPSRTPRRTPATRGPSGRALRRGHRCADHPERRQRHARGVPAAIDGVPVVAFCQRRPRPGRRDGRGGLRAHRRTPTTRAVRERRARSSASGTPAAPGSPRASSPCTRSAGSSRAMTQASGMVPQISVVLGPAAGGAAYGPALTDIVILGPEGRIFVTGPDVVRSVTGEDVDMAAPRRPRAAQPALRRRARRHQHRRRGPRCGPAGSPSLLGAPGPAATSARSRTSTSAACCRSRKRRAYDVHPLVDAACSTTAPGIELHAKWAPNIVTTLGRLGGRTVGVIANNPLRLGGCLDSPSAEKAARFVRMCDAFGVPLVVRRRRPRLPARASARSGTASYAAAPSCCTRSARRGPAGHAGDPQDLRRRVHRDELPLAGRHQGVRLAGRRDRGDGRGRRGPHPAPPQAGRGRPRRSAPQVEAELAAEHERIAGGVDGPSRSASSTRSSSRPDPRAPSPGPSPRRPRRAARTATSRSDGPGPQARNPTSTARPVQAPPGRGVRLSPVLTATTGPGHDRARPWRVSRACLEVPPVRSERCPGGPVARRRTESAWCWPATARRAANSVIEDSTHGPCTGRPRPCP